MNHVLRGAAWARDALQRHAGKTARIDTFPFPFLFTVLDGGEVAVAEPSAAPDVAVRLTPGQMLRLAARDESVWQEVTVTGDTDFAATINQVARNLRWDFEEDLSRVFGDVVAHRMAETGRALHRWGRQSLDNTARSTVEYWTEERPLVASARVLRDFASDVDALRDDVARLEKRIELLAAAGSRQAPR